MSIKLSNVSKIYGTQKAVDDISFELKKGEVVGFLGPNGAGKSTTMKMITTYIPPSFGEIWVEDIPIAEYPLQAKRKIGYLPESNPLYYDMYVREYLQFVRQIESDLSIPAGRIDEVIQLTGLGKEVHKQIGQLSKGYKQRVGLARAILHDPDVLILDEPTSGLDPNQIVEIRDLIAALGRKKTVMLSTHIMQEVQAICQRVIIINEGKIVTNQDIQSLEEEQNEQVYRVRFSSPVEATQLATLTQAAVEQINPNELRIVTDAKTDTRAIVQKWATDNDIYIDQWLNESGQLENIFRKLTQ